MQGSERALEASEAIVERERERAIAGIRGRLVLKGDEFCQDCGDPIGVERRAALPSATRCVGCQSAFERSKRK